MPSYFTRFGLIEPTDRHNTVIAFASSALGSTLWEIVNQSPARLSTFMLAMGAVEEQMPPLGSYDLSWVVEQAANSTTAGNEERAVVVDVGGGKGQALKGMLAVTEGLRGLRGRCVLEDLEEVVEAMREGEGGGELEGVRLVGMDFHKEQPVKGQFYYGMWWWCWLGVG
jgi:hypothetical protein